MEDASDGNGVSEDELERAATAMRAVTSSSIRPRRCTVSVPTRST
nr:hypothetical protein [Haladaptatus sp. W1]